MITQNIFQELKWRQVIYDSTPNCESLLKLKNISCYNGFDPTAQSLHIGNLIAIVGLIRFQKFGHSPIALIGGTTGMIGDPSGKNEERNESHYGHLNDVNNGRINEFFDKEKKILQKKICEKLGYYLGDH